MNREFRYLPARELRVSTDEQGKRKLSGLIPYNQRSVDLGGFVEQIAPGAFAKSLTGDILALRDHDPKLLLGRTKSGTLRFSDETDGLHYEIDIPNTTPGNDLVESVNRGDLDATSFGFYCIDEAWPDDASGTRVRTVLEAELFEVSPCSFAAYPTSSVSLRSLFPDGEVKPPEKRADNCDCDCPECTAGNCDECSDPDCDCEHCSCQQVRNLRLRLELAKRV